MPADRAVLVTGATGSVGRYVAEALLHAGERVRVTLRSSQVAPEGTEGVPFDFEDATTWAAAMDGVDRVFLMRPPAIADVDRVIAPFVATMAQQPLRQVAVLSLMGVNPAMPHWRLEKAVRAAGVPWVMLRPSFFMQNLETAYRGDVVEHDRIRLPAAHSRTSFVDTRDVAAVAAETLLHPGAHRAATYTITGAEALTWAEVAAVLSAELGRPIRYEAIPLRIARSEMQRAELPAAYVNVQLLIHVVARLGLAARVSATLPGLPGRRPGSLRSYVHDRRDCWAREDTV
jgi:uncharacterized protein YbjT (DUF2867 family)